MNCARSFRRDGDERGVGFGLIISAHLIRITLHDHRARPERVCVTAALTSGTGSQPIRETSRKGAGLWGHDELKRVYFSWIRADCYLGGCSRFTHVRSWLVVVSLRGAEMLAPKSSPLPSKSAHLLLMSLDLPTFTEVCCLYTLAELNNILWILAEKKKIKKKINTFEITVSKSVKLIVARWLLTNEVSRLPFFECVAKFSFSSILIGGKKYDDWKFVGKKSQCCVRKNKIKQGGRIIIHKDSNTHPVVSKQCVCTGMRASKVSF